MTSVSILFDKQKVGAFERETIAKELARTPELSNGYSIGMNDTRPGLAILNFEATESAKPEAIKTSITEALMRSGFGGLPVKSDTERAHEMNEYEAMVSAGEISCDRATYYRTFSNQFSFTIG